MNIQTHAVRQDKISCPVCGAEYSPSEIFVNQYQLIGQLVPKKDAYGKIVSAKGQRADKVEYYNCDYCKNTFSVRAYVYYKMQKEDGEPEVLKKDRQLLMDSIPDQKIFESFFNCRKGKGNASQDSKLANKQEEK